MSEFIDRSSESLVADSETAYQLVTDVLEPAADHFLQQDFRVSEALSVDMRRTVELQDVDGYISFSAVKDSYEHDYLDEIIECVNYKVSVVTFIQMKGQMVAENWDFYIDDTELEPRKEVYWEYLDDEGVVTDTEYFIDEYETIETEFDPDEVADHYFRALENEMLNTFSARDLMIIMSVIQSLGFTDFEIQA